MSDFADVLSRLNRIAGVRGSLVVSCEEGLLLDSEVLPDIPGEAVAAFAARVFSRARRSLLPFSYAPLTWLQLSFEHGFLFAAAAGGPAGFLVVVAADGRVNVGQVRLEATRLAEALV